MTLERYAVAEQIYTMGIDVGSTTSKAVIMKDGKEIITQAIIPAGTGTTGPARAVVGVLEATGMTIEKTSLVAATGYGRNSIQAELKISELSCHAKGAAWMFPGVRTVIDIGGQDVKVLSVTDGGRLDSFVMNDKCAAGTGRFLEVMARIMEKDISKMGDLDSRSEKRIDISSTCTVFAESEVISQLAQGVDSCDLIAGIHRSVAARAASLAKRLGVKEPVFMTGGVAKNSGVVRALAKELGITVKTDPRAQLAGAIGAAFFAYEQMIKR
jgi:predicted CoA-substrate-specific enzyme activase